ncbi:MAG: ABC transporter ATP-binding protein [Alkalispirochaetaceae bacterium]
MVRIENVEVTWPEFKLRASLTAEKGEVLSILGPSGSGKTTTLRIIAGFAPTEGGRVFVGDREVTTLPPQDRRIGFVFQDYTLFPHMNVFRNVAYGLEVQGLSRQEQQRRVARYLDLVGLPGYEQRTVETLSGGERQRVAVARALVVEPEVLLLDEPFSSIDAPLRKDLGSQLLRLQRALGITILFVTHSRSEALSISHKVAVMRKGEILQAGTPEELYRRPVDSFVAAFVGPANLLTGTLRGEKPGEPGSSLFESEELPHPLRISAAGESSATTLMIRPGALAFAPEGEARRGEEGAAREGATTLEARVIARQFFGHYFEYECELSTGRRLTLFSPESRSVGTACEILVAPEVPVLLPL